MNTTDLIYISIPIIIGVGGLVLSVLLHKALTIKDDSNDLPKDPYL